MVIVDTLGCDYLLLFIILHSDKVVGSDEDSTSSDEAEVMSSDENSTSSDEPTPTNVFTEIMEGLEYALEMYSNYTV